MTISKVIKGVYLLAIFIVFLLTIGNLVFYNGILFPVFGIMLCLFLLELLIWVEITEIKEGKHDKTTSRS